MPFYRENHISKLDAGTENIFMMTPELKAYYIAQALNTDKIERGAGELFPDQLQYEVSEKWSKMMNNVSENFIRFALFWKPRKGKTPAIELTFEKSNFDVLIALSRMGNISDEWISNTEKFTNLHQKGLELKDFLADNTHFTFAEKLVLTSTIQFLEKWAKIIENEKDEDNLEDQLVNIKKAKEIFRKEVKKNLVPRLRGLRIALALDEAHNGSLAEVTKMIIDVLIEELDIKVVFDITGTGETLYARNSYDEDKISEYTLIDEIELRRVKMEEYGLSFNDSEKKWIEIVSKIDFKKNPDARVLLVPTFRSYVAQASEFLSEDLIKKFGEFPNVRDILESTNENADYYNIIHSLLSFIFGLDKFKEATIQENGKLVENIFYDKGFINSKNILDYKRFAHMFFVEETKYGKVVEWMLNNSPGLAGNFEVINICGNEDKIKNTDHLNKKIEDGLARGKFVVIISAQMYGVGASLEMVRFVHHLNDGTSYSRKAQNGFRGQTVVLKEKIIDGEYKTIFKKDCLDIYYNMGQFLKIAWKNFDLKNNIKTTENKSTIEKEEILNCLLTNGVALKENDINSLFDELEKHKDKLKDFGRVTSYFNFQIFSEYGSEIKSLLKDLYNKEKTPEMKKELGDEDVVSHRKRKLSGSDENKEDSTNKKEFTDKDIYKINLFMKRIVDWMVYNHPVYKIENLKDLSSKLNELDFEIFFSGNKKLYDFIINKNIFDSNNLDDVIKFERMFRD